MTYRLHIVCVRSTHLVGGSGGIPPPEIFFNFSSSEVAFEPVLANSIASTTPRNRGILFGELEVARLVRMISNRRGY